LNGFVWSDGIPTITDKKLFLQEIILQKQTLILIYYIVLVRTGSTNVTIKKGRTMKIINEVDVQPTGLLL
jgi:hypothetical protein